ncbi:Uncharacterized protein FKW44_004473, partial [Caligus rogercresseyi]
MKALSKIGLTSHKKEERDEAASLKRAMEKFSFSHETDLSIAVQLLDCAIADLSAYREHFEESKQAAQGLSEKWGVSKAFENTRARKVKAHFDELSQDERLADADSYFRVHVFNACLDIVISQLTQRFTGLRSTAERFKAIQPMTLCTATDDELFRQASKLVDIYRDDITEDFPIQLLSFRACLKQRISQVKTVRELAKMLLIENSCITASFGEVCTVLMLFLTIPVTVASAERSFSKLKLIKSYLRSSMGQSRLFGLAILSIENARARQLDVQDLIEEFAQ